MRFLFYFSFAATALTLAVAFKITALLKFFGLLGTVFAFLGAGIRVSEYIKEKHPLVAGITSEERTGSWLRKRLEELTAHDRALRSDPQALSLTFSALAAMITLIVAIATISLL